MSRQHFIPASYIGNFSLKTSKNNRENVIWVKRRGKKESYQTKAEKVGYRKNIYSDAVDKNWEQTEKNLKKSIADLVSSKEMGLFADDWIVLVKFIAQLFIRGYEFNGRYQERIKSIFGNTHKLDEYINADRIRLFELQRFHAPVMYAKWLVLHNKTKIPIITNDLGFCLMIDTHTNKLGYAFPLSTKEVLTLSISDRTEKRRIPACSNHKKLYITNIKHEEMNDENIINGLNHALGSYCLEEIYGPTKESVNIKLASNRPTKYGTEPYFLVPSDDKNYLMNCEMDLFKFISIMSSDNPDAFLEELT